MPMIRVEMFKGRTREEKRALAKEPTEAFVRVLGGDAEGLRIVIRDLDKEDWARGGQLFADRYPD